MRCSASTTTGGAEKSMSATQAAITPGDLCHFPPGLLRSQSSDSESKSNGSMARTVAA